MSFVLAIDQGTTSTRALIFDANMNIIATAQQEFPQHYPASGWVEHDPQDLWNSTVETCTKAISNAAIQAKSIASIGITNQRETVIVWDKLTGDPIYNAIVWQDRRSTDYCAHLKDTGQEATITEVTGLLADPYFSGTKVKWLLDNVDGARERAEAGQLLFGTVDCYLIWRLSGGRIHRTDATNAARTMLYDIHRGAWSNEMCRLLTIPKSMLPEVRNCADDFGVTSRQIFGAEIAINGVAGDQQAATIGQACFAPGMVKSTYGTGCFALLNTGKTATMSQNRLLTTIAYQFDGTPTYALEGSIFVAGAVIQWLRDGLGVLQDAAQSGPMSERADPGQEVILVPAFVGLGAPYWRPDCRGAIYGLTRNTGANELARAAIESVGFQTRDLLVAMERDWGEQLDTILRVDGGMSASNQAMQFLSDIIGAPVDRPKSIETTALGAAWLAGMHAGIYPGMRNFEQNWTAERQFLPQMQQETRNSRYQAWKRAVQATLMV